jgi:hypothetical protein
MPTVMSGTQQLFNKFLLLSPLETNGILYGSVHSLPHSLLCLQHLYLTWLIPNGF